MLERIPDVGGPVLHQKGNALARAMKETLDKDEGLKCPEGCNGSSARWYGLVSHLIERHHYSKKRAENATHKAMS